MSSIFYKTSDIYRNNSPCNYTIIKNIVVKQELLSSHSNQCYFILITIYLNVYCLDVTVESSLNKFSLKFNYWELLQIIMIMGIIRIFVPLCCQTKRYKDSEKKGWKLHFQPLEKQLSWALQNIKEPRAHGTSRWKAGNCNVVFSYSVFHFLSKLPESCS